MPEQTMDVAVWIARVQKAKGAQEVFAILNEFRPLNWTDVERAAMGKAYVKVLDRVGVADVQAASAEEEKDSGPVWYEKM